MIEVFFYFLTLTAVVWWLFWRRDQGAFVRGVGGAALAVVLAMIGAPLWLAFGWSICTAVGLWAWQTRDA